MRHILLAGSLLLLLTLPLLAGAAGESLWVTAQGARLQSERSIESSTLTIVPVGEEVQVIRKEGRWYQVETLSGETGWMYQGRLSQTKPLGETDGQPEDLFGSLTGSQITAQQADTSRSIRGLSPETEAYAQNQHTPEKYRLALEDVLNRQVSNQELVGFLKQGQIGEYAN
jgi:uncharacterized protein YgiM (DUF1202 family)